MKKRCEFCKFYHAFHDDPNNTPNGYGLCRRRAPVLKGPDEHQYPTVARKGGCGDWKSHKDKPADPEALCAAPVAHLIRELTSRDNVWLYDFSKKPEWKLAGGYPAFVIAVDLQYEVKE